jgi:hypothetical protein
VTVPFQDFTNEVRVYFPDMPEPVVLGAVRNAAIEFCEKSLYWTYEHDPISAVADLTEYEFDLPEDTEVAKIIDGWYDDHVLVFASEERLQGQFQTPWRQTTGSAAFITQMDPQSFLLAPAPAENITDAIRLIVALKPTRDAPGIDDMFYSRWLEEIAGRRPCAPLRHPRAPDVQPGRRCSSAPAVRRRHQLRQDRAKPGPHPRHAGRAA